MADLETSLRTLALQNSAVSAAFSNRFALKYIPDDMDYPLIRAQAITNPFTRTHNGTHGGRKRVQLDVYDDETHESRCNTSADTLTAWLDNYNGAMGAHNVTIQVKNDVPMWEAETRLHRRMIEIEILYFKQV